jgi:glutathione peroxidase
MSFYDLSFNDTAGNTVSMKQFQGKVLLLVNTATKCGLAPQFVDLEKLHQEYKDKGLVVIGFPCNQFAGQEPETNETVVNVCQINYGVSFLLSEKIDVNGENTHPVFVYLKDNANSGILGDAIKWNFTKFLVSADGLTINRYAPTTNPMDIKADIEEFLQKI